ncbi:hypothetical protein EO087_02145 [Dyella sp. M7H15-1]|uniref:hypothetical protein n=1 Tax=Dyella sp. M7H15-1 TaxID=2501295 RepID=UPI001004FE17|nr:hypothetical protein [Dyella sp. M7H15-1]QAU22938.1 hypothetical protein EO087_02145 [Dyella sp. M7H15-1]
MLFVLCAFIALLLMNVGAVASTHVHTHASAYDVTPHALLADIPDTHAVSSDGTWHKVTDDLSGCGMVLVDDNDVDDEPVLLLPVRISLNYFLFAVPLSASIAPYSAPVAFLLRPPKLT